MVTLAESKLHIFLIITRNRTFRLYGAMIGGLTVMTFEVVRTPSATRGFGAYPTSVDVTINGAGATFPAPLYNAWSQEYGQQRKVAINYQAIGSGGGIKAITARSVDFGATDSPMTDAELSQAAGVIHIPTCVGCVVAAYNIPGGPTSIKLTGQVLADIFTGKIGTWNHAAIAGLNPGVRLPALRIVPVSRADSSGTTAIFTSYLARVSASFKAEIGEGKSVNIRVGVKGKGNDGVAALVRQTPGALGYVELAYAEKNNMPFALIQNAKGNWVVASIKSATESATAKDLPADFRAMITNTQDKEGYPIAGFTWLLIYPNAKREVKDFIRWCLTDGQKSAARYDYAPLPEPVRRRAFAAIGK